MIVPSSVHIVGAGVPISTLGIGTASLGDVFGAVTDEAAHEVVRAMRELGLRAIDTAPLYGAGLAETRLGRALHDEDAPELTVSTKVGRVLDARAPEGWRFDFSRDGIRRSLESSLVRLGRERVEVLYLHDPDGFEEQVYRDAWPALAALRAEGLVGAIGVGMNQWAMLLRFVERLDPDLIMVAGRYTLLDQSAGATLLPACAQRGVPVVLGGVFNSGILNEPVEGAWFDYRPAPIALVERARSLQAVAARHGASLSQIALQFAFAHPSVTSVVVGAGSAATVHRNLAALAEPTPADLWTELKHEGLLPTDAPVPSGGRSAGEA